MERVSFSFLCAHVKSFFFPAVFPAPGILAWSSGHTASTGLASYGAMGALLSITSVSIGLSALLFAV
jgi:hypothetical protein